LDQNLLLDFFDLQGKKVKSVRRSVAGLSSVEPGYFFNVGNQKKMMINWFKFFFSLYL